MKGWRTRLKRLRSSWQQVSRFVRYMRQADSRETERLILYYPRRSWYAEHAGELLSAAEEIAGRLEQELGLAFPTSGWRRTSCHVMGPDTAIALEGVTGAASQTWGSAMTIVGFAENDLPEFAATVAHELAHVLSFQLAVHVPSFLSEGFACHGAGVLGLHEQPEGYGGHCCLDRLLAAGELPSLLRRWEQPEYTWEFYELAWSFTDFLLHRYGRGHYYAFYRSPHAGLAERVRATFGKAVERLEADWYRMARDRAAAARQLAARRRWARAASGPAPWIQPPTDDSDLRSDSRPYPWRSHLLG